MSTIKRFEDIEAWQLSRELYKIIFRHTCEGDFIKDYGLKDQIRRSTGSIMDNIAEGFEKLYHETDVIGGKLATFIKYLKSSDFKGTKYK